MAVTSGLRGADADNPVHVSLDTSAITVNAIGSASDAAWSGTGDASAISALKAIHAASVSATPEGSNVIGIVDRDDVDVTGSVSSASVLFTQDVSRFGTAGVQVTSAGTACTIVYEGSIDGTTYYSVAGISSTATASVATTTSSSSASILIFPISGLKFFRARVSTYTSGTVSVAARFKKLPTPPQWATIPTSTPAISAGTSLIGDTGTQYRASSTGASSISSVLSPATPAGASIKASAGRMLGFCLTNTSAALRSVKFFNATSVTMGTTSAAFEIDIPAGQSVSFKLEGGSGFSTGIMWAVTSAKGLTDNTATGLAANDVSGAVFYA